MSRHFIRLLLVCVFSTLLPIAPSYGEVPRNTHIFAMVQLNHNCRADRRYIGEFVRIAIYRSNADRYYTYMMSTAGQVFESGGGRRSSTLDGIDMISELQFSGRRVNYRETGTIMRNGVSAVSTLEVQLTTDGRTCSVNSCSMSTSRNGDSNFCRYRCFAEPCEIRPGPAS